MVFVILNALSTIETLVLCIIHVKLCIIQEIM